MDRIDTSKGWVEAYFRSADSGNVQAIIGHLSDQAEFRFANAPAIVGKTAIEKELTLFLATLQSVTHFPEQILVDGPRAVQIATVRYLRLDDTEISLPVATYLARSEGGLIEKVWIFMDLAPLRSTEA